ncbi:hypothetical protein [Bacillus sp. NPDC094106]|uniref:hypothetical protein n=1 Tax=Bacillus sp. NPDC094106 TaxID=3363949 RepID=UPI0037F771EC
MSKNIQCPTCKQDSNMDMWDKKTRQFYGKDAMSIRLVSEVSWSEHVCPKCTSLAYNKELQ